MEFMYKAIPYKNETFAGDRLLEEWKLGCRVCLRKFDDEELSLQRVPVSKQNQISVMAFKIFSFIAFLFSL